MPNKSVLDLMLDGMDEGGEQPTPVQPDATKEPDKAEPEPAQGAEVIEIDGKTVTVSAAEDGTLEAEYPAEYDEMSEEDKVKFDRKVNDSVLTLAKLKQERMQQKDKDRKLSELEAEVTKLKEQIKTKPEPKDDDVDDEDDESDDEPRKFWGVESWDDVADLQTDDVKAYHKGLAKMTAANAQQGIAKVTADETLRKEIETAGYAYKEVLAFAKQKGISNVQVAFDYYKLSQSKSPVAQIRRKAPNPVKPGTNPAHAPTTKPSEADRLSNIIGGFE